MRTKPDEYNFGPGLEDGQLPPEYAQASEFSVGGAEYVESFEGTLPPEFSAGNFEGPQEKNKGSRLHAYLKKSFLMPVTAAVATVALVCAAFGLDPLGSDFLVDSGALPIPTEAPPVTEAPVTEPLVTEPLAVPAPPPGSFAGIEEPILDGDVTNYYYVTYVPTGQVYHNEALTDAAAYEDMEAWVQSVDDGSGYMVLYDYKVTPMGQRPSDGAVIVGDPDDPDNLFIAQGELIDLYRMDLYYAVYNHGQSPTEPPPAYIDHVMNWQDPALESAMREITGIPDGDIWLHDVWETTALELGSRYITRIDALADLTNLTYLNLSSNGVTDISPLAGLVNLEYLDLSYNDISDFSSLAGLTKLTNLSLGNFMTDAHADVSALRTLPDLTSLFLVADANVTDIRDINGLTDMTNLTTLVLSGGQLADISALGSMTNLTRLELRNCGVTDIVALAALKNLTTLQMSFNQVEDISALAGLTNLTRLELTYNNSNGSNGISDISVLSGMTKLETLDLSSNSISDLSPIGGLTSLTRLDLGSNGITDISALSGLTDLTYLELEFNDVADIDALRGMVGLTYLGLEWNYTLRNIDVLSSLPSLEEVNLEGTDFEGWTPS